MQKYNKQYLIYMYKWFKEHKCGKEKDVQFL